MKSLAILGGSGHAAVIIDAARRGKDYDPVAVLAPELAVGTSLKGVLVRGDDDQLAHLLEEYRELCVIIAIGDNKIRRSLAKRLSKQWPKLTFAVVLHPTAIIAEDVKIKQGSFVAAGAVISCGVRIGAHAVVNTAAVIDHASVLEDYGFIGPNAVLAGNVEIGQGTTIGAGASIIPGMKIGQYCTIGAGAVVIDNVADHITAVGVPAHIVK